MFGAVLYVIQHIPRAENHWGDFLSRWRTLEDEGRPCVRAHAIAVVGPTMGDFNMLSNGETRDLQETVAREESVLDTPLGKVVRHEDGLHRAEYGRASVV